MKSAQFGWGRIPTEVGDGKTEGQEGRLKSEQMNTEPARKVFLG